MTTSNITGTVQSAGLFQEGASLLGSEQHVLEEDYDENYEPTDEGTLYTNFGYHGHV